MISLSIEVAQEDWSKEEAKRDENSHSSDIHKVLVSAASKLWTFCPNTTLDKIFVFRNPEFPVALFERAKNGDIRVGLSAFDNRWAKFAYQFAHEFCHVLATQSNDPASVVRANKRNIKLVLGNLVRQGRAMRVAPVITLDNELRPWLQKQAGSALSSRRLVERCRIVLLAAQGEENLEIAATLGCSRYKVARWRNRFHESGRAGIERDAPGRGRKPVYGPEMSKLIVDRTLRARPPLATHWSRRTLAKALDIGATTVGKVWRAHGLKPHLARTFKVSNDPRFVEKLEDVVGLYLNRPEHALVLCCDEKSQVQALDRTQPGLPLKKGRAGTLTHDYVRHGTTTLFAALNVADGTLIGQCQDRHRHQEWLKFLQLIDEQTPADRDLHLILDNYATHKHPKVQKWLAKHPRFHLHFTPTSASWLNMVERFFRDLTVNRLRRGVFHSLPELVAALQQYIATYNKEPKPYVWTAKASDILAKVQRAREKLNRLEKVR